MTVYIHERDVLARLTARTRHTGESPVKVSHKALSKRFAARGHITADDSNLHFDGSVNWAGDSQTREEVTYDVPFKFIEDISVKRRFVVPWTIIQTTSGAQLWLRHFQAKDTAERLRKMPELAKILGS